MTSLIFYHGKLPHISCDENSNVSHYGSEHLTVEV